MPDHEAAGLPADLPGPAPETPGPSRRSVLRGAAGAGVAGIAATALAGTVAAPALAATRGGATPRPAAEEATDQIVVHVRDARSGEIDVFRGTSQTRLHDKELAARLVRASR